MRRGRDIDLLEVFDLRTADFVVARAMTRSSSAMGDIMILPASAPVKGLLATRQASDIIEVARASEAKMALRFPDGIMGLALALALAACSAGGDRGAAITVVDEAEIMVMDFARPPALQDLPPGWHHRRFWTRLPMEMSLVIKDGVPAIRLATQGTASMLMRIADIDLQQYPRLVWRWHIEQPIEAAASELTREGDDHPARLFITLRTAGGENRSLEIV